MTKLQWNLKRNATISIQKNVFKSVFCQFLGHFVPALTLNVQGPSYLGLTGSLRRQGISSHDIDFVE